jgi:hypothetical protein
MAHGAPGEFAADTLLRIAALDALPAPQRIQLVEEAFRRAAEAQQPLKRRNAMRGISANGGFQQRAFAQDLDALSLRARAVEEMLPLDAAKARRLFSQIPSLRVPAVTCEDVLIYDVSIYYRALSEIAHGTFSPKEIAAGAAYQLVQEHLALISSPAEIAPAAHAAIDSGLDDLQFSGAIASIATALTRMSGDDRSFTYYLPDTGAAIELLAQESQRRRISPTPITEAYRTYLVSNFSAARCADDDAMEGSVSTPGTGLDARSATAIRFFNENLRKQLQPIEGAETVASSKTGAAAGQRSCQSTDCANVAKQYRALVFDPTGAALPTKARESMEWRDSFSAVLDALRDWQDGGDSNSQEAAHQFREKCTFYTELAGLAPDTRQQETALRAMLDYLVRGRDRAYTRAEWLLPVNMLIGRMTLDPQGMGRLAEDFRRSTDPVIAMYAQLEVAAPRAAPDVLALM